MTNTTAAAVVPAWTLTDRLRKARDHARLTQAQLARKLDVHEKTIKRAEAGERVQLRTLVAWAWCTGVDVQWLLRGDDPDDGGPGADTGAVTHDYDAGRIAGVTALRAFGDSLVTIPELTAA